MQITDCCTNLNFKVFLQSSFFKPVMADFVVVAVWVYYASALILDLIFFIVNKFLQNYTQFFFKTKSKN